MPESFSIQLWEEVLVWNTEWGQIRKLCHGRLNLITVSLLWKIEYLKSQGIIISLLQRCIAKEIAIIKDRLLLELVKRYHCYGEQSSE